MKIYTKTGDQGKTRLVDGQECTKSTPRVQAYGSVDELNSFLGLAVCFGEQLSQSKTQAQTKDTDFSKIDSLCKIILSIQNQLFNLGSHIACESHETRKLLPQIKSAWVQTLEQQIDEMTAELEPLRNFILPGGNILSCQLHICRTVARRAERDLVELMEELEHPIDSEIELCLIYLNRLSDFLFTAARYANKLNHQPDQIWKKE